jgi:hypothetical protein
MTSQGVHISSVCSPERAFTVLLLLTLIVPVPLACGPKAQGPFTDKIVQEYVSMATLTEETQGDTYIVGKAVLINTGESISHHHQTAFTKDEDFDIQSQTVSSANQQISNRATNPGDAGTLVLLKWSKEVLSENIAGIKFCRVHCEVIVVDNTKHRIVGKKQFAGSYPNGLHRWGSSPETEVVKYINSLPRRESSVLKETTPGAQGPERPGAGMRMYSDATNKLSFSYPAGWKEMTPSGARQVMGAETPKWLTVVLYDPEDRTQNVNVQVMSPVAAGDLTEAAYREFLKGMDRHLSDLPGFRKVSGKVTRLSTMTSLEYVYDTTRPDGVRVRQKQLRTGRGGREVVMTFSSKGELYDQVDKTVFNVIVSTMKVE